MKEVILGIGNTLKGDDGIGIYIAERINKYLKEVKGESEQAKFMEARRKVIAINCGTTPENYTSIIRKHNPDRLILVDAAEMGLSPGSYRIIPPEKIEVMHVSTHVMSLSFLISYVSEFCKDIILVGVQPKRMDFSTALSSAVRRSGDHVANLIMEERLSEIMTLKKTSSIN
jgi:hydrogenase 3 maturation protease